LPAEKRILHGDEEDNGSGAVKKERPAPKSNRDLATIRSTRKSDRRQQNQQGKMNKAQMTKIDFL
jgi:hypothetical protein